MEGPLHIILYCRPEQCVSGSIFLGLKPSVGFILNRILIETILYLVDDYVVDSHPTECV